MTRPSELETAVAVGGQGSGPSGVAAAQLLGLTTHVPATVEVTVPGKVPSPAQCGVCVSGPGRPRAANVALLQSKPRSHTCCETHTPQRPRGGAARNASANYSRMNCTRPGPRRRGIVGAAGTGTGALGGARRVSDDRLVREPDTVAAVSVTAAERTGVPARQIERDFRVTEVLRSVVTAAANLGVEVAFKGGTRLSKAFSFIIWLISARVRQR